MNSTEKWLIKFKQYRYRIIFMGLILLILIVGCVFVLGGGIDKIRENTQDNSEKVPPAEAEDLITNDIQQVAKCADTTYTVVFVPWSAE